MTISIGHHPFDSNLIKYLMPVLAIAVILVSGCVIFMIQGQSPWTSLYTFIVLLLSDSYGLSEFGIEATPFLLCTMGGLADCYHTNVWTIGAAGQLLIRASVGSWAALSLMNSSDHPVLQVILMTGTIAVFVWPLIPETLKNHFNTNKILTTIIWSYIAWNLLLFAVHGPLKGAGGFNFPESVLFTVTAILTIIMEETRLHLELLLDLFAVTFLCVVSTKIFLGFEQKAVGSITLGKLAPDKSCTLNLSQESMILMGAIVSFIAILASEGLLFSVLMGLIAGLAMAMLFGTITLQPSENQVAIKFPLIIFGSGLRVEADNNLPSSSPRRRGSIARFPPPWE
ncbi:MAG: ABC transporter permease subunit [Endozoicomonas sp.]